MKSLSSTCLLWSVPFAMAVHNAEEAVGVRFLSADSGPLAAWRRVWGSASEGYLAFDLALVVLTVAVFVVAALSKLSDPRSLGARTLLVVQVGMLVNAFWHVAAAIMLRGYAPGVLTALLVEVPISIVVLGRNWREQWLSRRATVAAGLIVAVLHVVPALAFLAAFGR